jgi:hypothetical protein
VIFEVKCLLLQDMVNALGAYVQSVFANPMNAMNPVINNASGGGGGGNSAPSSNSLNNGPSSTSGDTSTVGFYFRGSLVPLIHMYQPSTPKPQLYATH